mmetsp:Transcript_17563/g.56993  ORF Transcript_17563/g.56993 Transcript_17563/m.56993 type:complete len:248 (-) Transcript_17563:197-940(-)
MPFWNSGRKSVKGTFLRFRSVSSSSAGLTRVTQSRSLKKVPSKVRIWFREAASLLKEFCGLRAFSRYWRSLIFRPRSSRRSVKSRTTHVNAGKWSANASSSWDTPVTGFAACACDDDEEADFLVIFFLTSSSSSSRRSAVALAPALERTWMCFVRFTTRAKSSRALPSMTPREFQTKSDDSRSAKEKIWESSVCVRLVEPRPSVSTKSTVKPSSKVTGSPQSQRPFVQAFTVAPTSKPPLRVAAPLR